MGRIYAEALTKSYLEKLGITNVSEDGKIFRGDNEVSQHLSNSGHLIVMLYDPLRRLAVPPAERTNTTGSVYLPVHRIVYAWYHGEVPTGLVCDHCNNIKTDNRLENLQLLTPGENIWKERVCNTREVKCKLNKPRTFYEEKLSTLEAQYEVAKAEHRPNLVHSLRGSISVLRAKLRYYDSHVKERIELV